MFYFLNETVQRGSSKFSCRCRINEPKKKGVSVRGPAWRKGKFKLSAFRITAYYNKNKRKRR